MKCQKSKLSEHFRKLRFQKKGQVTEFIIVGVIVLFVVLAFILVEKEGVEQDLLEDINLIPFAKPVKNFVDSCLQSEVEESLQLVSNLGGFHDLPETHKDESGFLLPYYFLENQNVMPSKEIIEEQFALTVEEEMVDCVNEFRVFKEQGFDISYENPEVEVFINPGFVNVQLEYPLEIEKDDQFTELRLFDFKLRYDFDEKINFITGFMERQEAEVDYLPLSYLVDLADQEDFTFEMLYFNDTTVGMNVLFADTDLYDSLNYSFALQFPEFEELPEPVLLDDMVPDVIPEQSFFTIPQGDKFIYQVQVVEGEASEFYDFTNLFDIDKVTGVINFDTTGVEKGSYDTLIQAIDIHGNSDLKELTVVIE